MVGGTAAGRVVNPPACWGVSTRLGGNGGQQGVWVEGGTARWNGLTAGMQNGTDNNQTTHLGGAEPCHRLQAARRTPRTVTRAWQ